MGHRLGQERLFHHALLLFAHRQSFRRFFDDSPRALTTNLFNKMPKYWMVNNRSQGGVGPDVSTDGMTYWVSDKQPLTDIKNWRKVTAANFQKLLVAASDKFPKYDQAENEKQSHVTIDRKSTRLNSSHPSISYAVF